MIFKRSDIPFASDDSHRFLPWLIGVMACLATLLLCVGVTINGWIISHNSNYSGSFTVNVPAGLSDADSKIGKVQDNLKKITGVTDVSKLTDGQVKDLLKPWLGNDDTLDSLPLPVVIDVTMDSAAAHPDYASLQKTLAAIAPGTEIDAHERWVSAFADFSATAQFLMTVFAVLILSSMGVMIAFTSRASLKLHAKTVHLLHAIGAEDRYIARQFQGEAFKLVLPGAALGCLAAGFIYWAIGIYITSLPASLMPSLSMRKAHLILLLMMPPLCAFAACAVSRWSVMRQLQDTL